MGKMLRKVKRATKTVVTGAATVVGTVVGVELACLGMQCVVNDVNVIKNELTPKPIEVKTGWKKSKVVAKKPFSNEYKTYTGDKNPVAKVSKKKFTKLTGQQL